MQNISDGTDLPPSYYDVTGVHSAEKGSAVPTTHDMQIEMRKTSESDEIQVSYQFTNPVCPQSENYVSEFERQRHLPGVQIQVINEEISQAVEKVNYVYNIPFCTVLLV